MRILKRQLFFIVTFSFACMLNACNNNNSSNENNIQSIMTQVKAELHDSITVEKEASFQVRPFNPYIGDNWIGNAVSYGCYRKGQAPGQKGPSEDEILEDLQIISKHWNLIRVYGSGADAKRILQVIENHKLPIKMMLGIWLEPEENNVERKKANEEQVLSGIELSKLYADIILAVSVGNETQVFWSWHKMNSKNLVRYIRFLRNNVTVPVTTADDYNFWNKPESKEVSGEIDFITTHMHPLWNGKQLENSMSWVGEVYQDIQSLHPDKKIIVGETGWATDYNVEKIGDGQQGTLIKGEVGVDAQAVYLNLHNKWVDSSKVTTFLFEVFDESWKGGGENSPTNEVEKHWGVYYENRTPKKSITEYQK